MDKVKEPQKKAYQSFFCQFSRYIASVIFVEKRHEWHNLEIYTPLRGYVKGIVCIWIATRYLVSDSTEFGVLKLIPQLKYFLKRNGVENLYFPKLAPNY